MQKEPPKIRMESSEALFLYMIVSLKTGIIKRCTYLSEKWTYLRLFVKRYSSIKQNQALKG